MQMLILNKKFSTGKYSFYLINCTTVSRQRSTQEI